jgi:hypothetical protein
MRLKEFLKEAVRNAKVKTLLEGGNLRLPTGDEAQQINLQVTDRKTMLPILNHLLGSINHAYSATFKNPLWSPELLAAVDEAIAARPCLSPFLFCTARGKGFFNEATGRCPGWKSMWQRFVEKVMAETKITEKFTDHDIRAKVGSDKESDEEARKTLSHSTSATTKRHYRRKAEVVRTGTN